MTEPPKTGVFQTQDSLWSWRCQCGTEATTPHAEREEARTEYKGHRAACESANPTPSPAGGSMPETATQSPKKAAKRKSTKKAKPASKSRAKATKKRAKGSGKVFRLSLQKNPKTGREVLIPVNSKGVVRKAPAARTGIKTVKSWHEAVAPSRAKAAKLIRSGKGTLVRASDRK